MIEWDCNTILKLDYDNIINKFRNRKGLIKQDGCWNRFLFYKYE